MNRHALVLLMLIGGPVGAWAAGTPTLSLSLEEATDAAWRRSHRLQAKVFEVEAYRAREDAVGSVLWPRLSLEGTWRYVTEVPSLQLLPGRPAVQFGDHRNYSFGPQLTWNLLDSGGTYFTWKATQALSRAKAEEADALRRELRLRACLAYFQTQLALARSGLLTDQLELARAQYRDIGRQVRAGQAGRIDLLSSHQEVIATERQLLQARTDLAGALRDLLDLTGSGADLDPSLPGEAGTPPAAGASPTVLLALDPLDRSLAALEPTARAALDPRHPRAQAFLDLAEAGRRSADGLGSAHWPKVQVLAKTSWDYPNGPVLETVHQNTAAVNLSWSLYEFGRVVNQTKEQERTADFNEEQARQAGADLQLAWRKAQDQLAQARGLLDLDRQAVAETTELARLVYQAYRAGRSNYLEVQSANTRALAAKVQALHTKVQLLVQLATLESLAETGESAERRK